MYVQGTTSREHTDPRNSSGQTMKRRSACNRCHELKNKCSGPDSRDGICERCRRLGIQCVFGVRAVMGRPRKYKSREPNSNRDGQPSPQISEASGTWSSVSNDDNVFLNRFLDNTATEYTEQSFRDFTYGEDAGQEVQFDMLPKTEYNWTNYFLNDNAFFPENMGSGLNSQAHTNNDMTKGTTESGYPSGLLVPQQFDGIEVPPNISQGTLQELSSLETKLQSLAFTLQRTIPTHGVGNSMVSEILGSMQTLTDILGRQIAEDMASIHHAHNENSHQQALDTPIDASGRTLLVLHTSTCYTYLLRLLQPLIEFTIRSQARGLHLHMPISLIYQMARHAQEAVYKVVYRHGTNMPQVWDTPCREFDDGFSPPARIGSCGMMLNGVESAMSSVHAKEAMVFDLLSQLGTVDSSPNGP